MTINAAVNNAPIPEITKQQASEYDHIVLIDRSGSMATESKRLKGKSRWQEVEEYALGFASYLAGVDDDGITIITFNSNITVVDGVKDAGAVAAIFKKQAPGGGTNLHLALEAALQKIQSSSKPAIVHVFTDGEPNDEQAVKQVIAKAVAGMKKDADLGFNFMQVGDDAGATKFLNDLDDNLQKEMGLKFDAVNALTVNDMNSLTSGQILYLALND